MKKVNFTLLILMVSVLASFAQMPYRGNLNYKTDPQISKVSQNLLKKVAELKKQKESQKAKASSSAYWINYGDALDADPTYSGLLQNNLGTWPFWPDSNAVIVPSAAPNTPFNWWTHGAAYTFSPASNYIAQYAKNNLSIPNGDLFFNRNNSFTIDSIRFYYSYAIKNAGVDTLLLSIVNYNSSAHFKSGFINTPDTTWFSGLDYSPATNAPTGTNITTVKIILTPADSANVMKTIPVNVTIPALANDGKRYGNRIAVGFTFQPGVKALLGDTLLNFATGGTITKQLNNLELFCFEETSGGLPGSGAIDLSYNLGQVVTTDVRYNNAASWNGSYIPTNAFSSGSFFPEHLYTDFHLKFEGAAFTYTKSIATANFTDVSNFVATSWSWDFGDGNSANTKNPSNTYAANGTYNVCLTASNGTVSYTTCRQVKITQVGINEASEFTLGNVYPNPVVAGTMMNIPVELNGTANQAIVKVYNTVGQVVSQSNQVVNDKVTVATNNLTEGMYMFSVEINGQKTTGKFSVVK